jgi:hypothetical protein
MDYWGTLSELYRERQRLDKVIRHLQSLAEGGSPSPLSRRGRKSMSEAERKLVSERMRTYWASRKAGKGAQ